MTEDPTDAILAESWPPPDAPDPIPTPRKCRHIRTWRTFHSDAVQPAHGPLQGHSDCGQCGKCMDPAMTKRGRSSDRLGKDQERRIQAVYGPQKIGQRGDAVDHIGRVWRWQSKATRALPPKWLAAIDGPTHHDVTASIAAAWNAMTGLYGTRRSVVIRSFVSRGIRTRDWLFLDAHDGVAEFGYDTLPYVTGWWVIPGDWWLDHFGRDTASKESPDAR